MSVIYSHLQTIFNKRLKLYITQRAKLDYPENHLQTAGLIHAII